MNITGEHGLPTATERIPVSAHRTAVTSRRKNVPAVQLPIKTEPFAAFVTHHTAKSMRAQIQRRLQPQPQRRLQIRHRKQQPRHRIRHRLHQHRQNTDGSLAIRGSGEVSKFREVNVDGVTVDPVNYTVTEGSTIITFKPEYLKSLSAGNHSFELVWTDGTAATNFTVAENADQSAKSPKTGEDFSMALCTALLMVSCAGLAGIFAKRKRNHAR